MMRYWFIAFIAAVFCTSCSSDENELLEGKWQLHQMEVDGQTIQVDTVFYNFQTSLFQYQIYTPNTDAMRQCYGFKTWEGEKQLVLELEGATADFLSLTDWSSSKESFMIEKLSGSKLILNRDNKRYIFRKF